MQKDDACIFKRALKTIERGRLHSATVGFETVDCGFCNARALSEHPNADAKACTCHTDLSGRDHF